MELTISLHKKFKDNSSEWANFKNTIFKDGRDFLEQVEQNVDEWNLMEGVDTFVQDMIFKLKPELFMEVEELLVKSNIRWQDITGFPLIKYNSLLGHLTTTSKDLVVNKIRYFATINVIRLSLIHI